MTECGAGGSDEENDGKRPCDGDNGGCGGYVGDGGGSDGIRRAGRKFAHVWRNGEEDEMETKKEAARKSRAGAQMVGAIWERSGPPSGQPPH